MKLDWGRGTVTGEWDEPDGDPRSVLVLAHGAGGDLKDPVLRAVSGKLASEGFAVLRFNFPYRESGRRSPGSQAESEACYRAVAGSARRKGVPLLIGGKSYGGRIASHIVGEGFPAEGLVFLSYPLHAPGRTDKLRDEHLRDIDVPMLFVQGTRDSFAQPELLARVVSELPAATHVAIEGGDHSLRVRGRSASEVAEEIASAVTSFALRSARR